MKPSTHQTENRNSTSNLNKEKSIKGDQTQNGRIKVTLDKMVRRIWGFTATALLSAKTYREYANVKA